MKLDVLLKVALAVLVVALTATVTLWFTSERSSARAQGGGGDSTDGWIMVTAQLSQGDGYVYMFNTRKEVLLIYALYSRTQQRGSSRFSNADLEFLAGRHCKWDLLYAQLLPYPTTTPRSGVRTPSQMKGLFERASREAR